MRTWGVTFVIVGGAGVFLPEPLWWWLVAVVSAAGVLAACSAYSDVRTRREIQAAFETGKHRAWISEMKAIKQDPDEWERVLDAVEGRHRTRYELVPPAGRLRSITRLPQQRRPSASS